MLSLAVGDGIPERVGLLFAGVFSEACASFGSLRDWPKNIFGLLLEPAPDLLSFSEPSESNDLIGVDGLASLILLDASVLGKADSVAACDLD